MVCVYCQASTQVTNSRLQRRLNQVWRRRRCTNCKASFTTHEKADLTATLMLRHTNNLAPFDRDTLFISIYESCKHRPAAITNAQALVQTIISVVAKQAADGVVERDTVVAVTMEVLTRYDPVAATMYSAYHKAGL